MTSMNSTVVITLVLLTFLLPFSYAQTTGDKPVPTGAGNVSIDVTDTLGRSLPARVELRSSKLEQPIRIDATKGSVVQPCPSGRFRAYVTVYQDNFPSVVAIKNVEVKAGETAFVLVNVIEGMAKGSSLQNFDQDGDLIIDRVEVEEKTDPLDAGSYPGAVPVPYDVRPLKGKTGWLRGELHALSSHGEGNQSVAELVRQAEKLNLDFLAITDRNTMAACMDPAFESKSVVLIPAMEWGDDKRGVALIYGPRTFPETVDSLTDAQGIAQRVQAQGGIFAVAHPCFPTCPWQWGLRYVNAIEVWCRGWHEAPPMSIETLAPGYSKRNEKTGKLVYSIARAAETNNLSANGQAALFWDYELLRGLRACAIAGSRSADPKVPLGQPITYVYAQEKSLPGILDGLWHGRTYVSSGPTGPRLDFTADVKKRAKDKHVVDVGMGGIIPIGMETELFARVEGAKGKKIQILYNGLPILTKIIDSDKFAAGILQTPLSYSVYRVRVIEAAQGEGFGNVEVLAMSSPIYAMEFVLLDTEEATPDEVWEQMQPSSRTPIKATEIKEANGQKWVRPDSREPVESKAPEEFVPPPGVQIREIVPVPLDRK